MKARSVLRLFDGYGVEVEYMIVNSKSLEVMPISDELLRMLAGLSPGEHPNGADINGISVSNELVLHVIELCNSDPSPSLSPLADLFQRAVESINSALASAGARLMPTAMHPWMDPAKETCIWPHEYSEVYRTYDSIFNCHRHGWANVQSSQLNLSFSGDEEFGALHAACRFLLPILPALAASSPVVEGRATGFLDSRLVHYRTNQEAVPSVSGRVIPEPAYTEGIYRETILERMYRDMEERDPEGVLRYEWLNSRGAIPRFDRSAVEIRVMDAQECPAADIAVAGLVAGVIRAICSGRWRDPSVIASWPIDRLAPILDSTVRSGEDAVIEDGEYLEALGIKLKNAAASKVWRHLADEVSVPAEGQDPLEVILDKGTLAKRILRAVGLSTDRDKLKKVYSRLCDCLAEGRVFVP
jgi:glutamate---cysteine ligase / carboxylate-amine ligase